MTPPNKRLDRIDIGILDQLQRNARITNADLAHSVSLSPTPCFNRVRALDKLGLFKQHVTLLNPEPLGLRMNVFIQVRLEKQIEEALQSFERAITERPEVMECYLMTGRCGLFAARGGARHPRAGALHPRPFDEDSRRIEHPLKLRAEAGSL